MWRVPRQRHILARSHSPALLLVLLVCGACARHLDSKRSLVQRFSHPTAAAAAPKSSPPIRPRSSVTAGRARPEPEPSRAVAGVAASGGHPVDSLGSSTPAATSTSGTLPPHAWTIVESRTPIGQHDTAVATAQKGRESRPEKARVHLSMISAVVLGLAVLASIAAILWLPRRVRS